MGNVPVLSVVVSFESRDRMIVPRDLRRERWEALLQMHRVEYDNGTVGQRDDCRPFASSQN